MTGPQRTTAVTNGLLSAQFIEQSRLPLQVTPVAREFLTRKRSQVQTLSHPPHLTSTNRESSSVVPGGCGADAGQSVCLACREQGIFEDLSARQPATDARQTARFGACQRERPRLQAAATGPCWDWGASVSGRQRRLERRLPRRLWRSRWARRFPMAEPACWAISSRKARSGSQRISKRHPASSHHKDRVHTLAPRPTRGIGFNGGTGATKKRPACARRSAPVALFGHTPTTTCRSVMIGQAIGQVSWSTAVHLSAVTAVSSQSGHRTYRRARLDGPRRRPLSA
jgi:hypothetical protein